MNRIRNIVGAATLALAAVAMTAPAAKAEVAWNLNVSVGSYGAYGSRPVVHRHRHIAHPAHRFFDGRLYCAGQNAWGHWVSDDRCEDQYGRKLVNNPRFVQMVLRNERRDWRRDRNGWRDERVGYWNR